MRRNKWLVQKIDWEAPSSVIVMVEESERAATTHTFRLVQGHLTGKTSRGQWKPCTGRAWDRRVNLLKDPPKNISLFQAFRVDGKWITAAEWARQAPP